MRSQKSITDCADLAKQSASDSQDYAVSQYSYRMPFGIYRGREIVSVPDSYLRWLRRTTNNLDTARRCSDEIERRRRTSRGRL